ncbi:RNA polymerase sigma factor SigY [Paenibacillus sp. JNUCC31]|uniref:RNA polymerase sigma factor SigY n=1 Tax=Paenibacillus sp. JNUCC-31 TaxID=2777983 RepID=UPI00177F11CC|nr:RNA polymerase sigma factor SigY [Paenibacillus sp. JNUCC-31]QOS81085.1 RNA polymerase sigma factor SigY [Paenibacillus sp. JNUCC-31]
MKAAELEEVQRAIQGDDAALAELLQRHYVFVYKYLVKVTMDPNVAEETVQDTMIRCMENIHRYDGSSAFSSWMITIATRIYIDKTRRRRREQIWLESIRNQAVRKLRWQFDIRNEEWTDVMDAMTRLTPEHRIAVLLKHYYGYGYDEIGEMLGIPSGTAKSRTAYGLRQLRKELDEHEQI